MIHILLYMASKRLLQHSTGIYSVTKISNNGTISLKTEKNYAFKMFQQVCYKQFQNFMALITPSREVKLGIMHNTTMSVHFSHFWAAECRNLIEINSSLVTYSPRLTMLTL